MVGVEVTLQSFLRGGGTLSLKMRIGVLHLRSEHGWPSSSIRLKLTVWKLFALQQRQTEAKDVNPDSNN